uniref:Integrase n=1 Tax=viral metagenome TaxID=1070528 RepID=A0A6M3LTF4_9ZZZZ
MADFRVKKQTDGRYYIYAPMRDHTGRQVGITERWFNPENNKLEMS